MFIHSFFYTLKQLYRDKAQVFWSLLFPIILATMFYLAFSNLSEDEAFNAIPVAVVPKEAASVESIPGTFPSEAIAMTNHAAFQGIIDALSEPGDDQFLEAVYATEEEALSLLENKEIVGILYEGTPVTLTISAEMTTMKLEQSILNAFVEQFNMNFEAIRDIAASHPENLPAAITALSAETAYNTETSFSDGSMDEMLTYFFNLIAMTCLFSYMGGLTVALHSQANLSALGARKCISPVPKLPSLCGELCAAFLFHFTSVLVSLLYLMFVLKINFGTETGYVMLAALTGCIAGVSFGFFIGRIGKMNRNLKYGVTIAISMICCFFSGLMVGNIRIIIEKICPWFNHINPAALISDSFYALTVYQSHTRFFQNIITLFIISALLCFGGVLTVRREKYAAL